VSVRTFTVETPPEPPAGSVVLDPTGLAWQRLVDFQESAWCMARPPGVMLPTMQSPIRSWAALLLEQRELRLIYDPTLSVQMPDIVPIPAELLERG